MREARVRRIAGGRAQAPLPWRVDNMSAPASLGQSIGRAIEMIESATKVRRGEIREHSDRVTTIWSGLQGGVDKGIDAVEISHRRLRSGGLGRAAAGSHASSTSPVGSPSMLKAFFSRDRLRGRPRLWSAPNCRAKAVRRGNRIAASYSRT